MIFKELINDLKKIKTHDDINEDTPDHLTAAAIGAYLTFFSKESDIIDEHEAFEMTRSLILKQLDFVLLEIMDQPSMGMENDPNSPINDPDFNKSMQKAIEKYNKKMDA